MADGKPEPGAFAFQFGGEKGIKYLMQILFGDSRAGISHRNLDKIIDRLSRDGQGAAFGHGMAAVHEKIQKDLFDLLGVHHDLRQIGGQLVADPDIGRRFPAFGQIQGLGHDFRNVHRAEFGFRGFGKAHQVLDDIGNPCFLFGDDPQSVDQRPVIGQLVDQSFQDLQV